MITRKEINEYITKALNGWSKGYSVECHLNDSTINWNGETISLKEMRRISQPGEFWFLDRYHPAKCYKDNDDMKEITIPNS